MLLTSTNIYLFGFGYSLYSIYIIDKVKTRMRQNELESKADQVQETVVLRVLYTQE